MLTNLLFTVYLHFHLYRDGLFVTKINIAEIQGDEVVSQPQHFEAFTNLIKDYCTHVAQTIKNSKQFARMVAGKARLLSDVIEQVLNNDETHQKNSILRDQMTAFRQLLIHDITPKSFTDVYAQTIAYVMFAARQ